MAKVRLSKLQKWILEKCLKDLTIYYRDVFAFFGKEFSDHYRKKIIPDFAIDRVYPNKKDKFEKKEGIFLVWDFKENKRIPQKKEYYKAKEKYIITNSEKAIISRSLKGLIKKGFLIKPEKWGECRLTKEGFLKANNFSTRCIFVSFKEYQEKLEKAEQEKQEAYKKRYQKLIEDFKNINKG